MPTPESIARRLGIEPGNPYTRTGYEFLAGRGAVEQTRYDSDSRVVETADVEDKRSLVGLRLVALVPGFGLVGDVLGRGRWRVV